MNGGVRGDDGGFGECEGFAGVVAEFAAGFFEDEHPCGFVPRIELGFPVAVETAAGDVAEVECGGAETADFLSLHQEFSENLQVFIRIFSAVVGETGSKQGIV